MSALSGNSQSPRVVFAGTPEFSVTVLIALLEAGFAVPAVFTQPDRPAGRGRKLTASPVKRLAQSHQIPVLQPERLDPGSVERLRTFNADAVVVAAYGLILPAQFLHTPSLGCINVHASLLPRWRGAAPIQRAILAGDAETGITIMQMDEGLDTGAILAAESCPIRSDDTSQTLHDRLTEIGQRLLPATLAAVAAGDAQARPQNPSAVTYAERLSKGEALIDWSDSAAELDRKVRAFNPWPVAFTHLDGERLRIWQAEPREQRANTDPGVVADLSEAGIDVATGKGTLRLKQLQLPGGRSVSAGDFLNARKLEPGIRLK